MPLRTVEGPGQGGSGQPACSGLVPPHAAGRCVGLCCDGLLFPGDAISSLPDVAQELFFTRAAGCKTGAGSLRPRCAQGRREERVAPREPSVPGHT